MNTIHKLAYSIRHTPGLEKAEFLWNILRKPYLKLLNLSSKGVEVSVSNRCIIRIPSEFCGTTSWEEYEPETVAALVDWLQTHPTALILDIGCAIGVFCVIGLFVSDQTEVIAFDSDLPSLKATERMCKYASGKRIKVIQGLISDEHLSGLDLETACLQTQTVLSQQSITGDPGTNTYICIDSNSDNTIPIHSLDSLLFTNNPPNKPILLKCDVEGAELLVLHGAKKLLEQLSPQLLISVHPPTLPNYGHSVSEVREYLEDLGYQIKILAIDHEEHWWCQKTSVI